MTNCAKDKQKGGPHLGMGIEVWTLELTRIRDQLRRQPCLKTLLGPSERMQAESYASTALSERYTAAHVGLRSILVQRCGTKVASQEFATTPTGKPFLPGGPHFSLSRAGSLGLVAISEKSSVGVDIEQKRKIAIDDWSARYPILRLFAKDFVWDGPGAFLQGWVRLEAWCKRRALPLARMLDNHEAELARKGETFETFDPGPELQQLTVPSGYLAWCACDTDGGILQRSLDL